MDGGMESDQSAGHLHPGGIGIKAAVDAVALVQERSLPAWVGSGAGCGDAAVLGMEGKATDGIDGGLAKDDFLEMGGGNGEEAEVFL